MNRACRWTLSALLLASASCARADDFDRLEGAVLSGLPTSDKVTSRDRLNIAELGALRSPFRDMRSPVLIVRTSKGNLARLVVAFAYRDVAEAEASFPIVVIERFETFEMPGAKHRIARGRDVWLFDGFHYDLDAGQVVHEEMGGDLRFVAGGEGGPKLVVEGKAKLYALNSSPFPAAGPGGKGPSSGRAIAPGDFAGRYRLFANGQISGALEIKVDDHGAASGSFRSDQTGSVYPISGQVAPESPGLIKFAVIFPRSRQEFDGYLWAAGKGALAGTSTLVNSTFGFFAVLEGGRLSPEDDDARLIASPDEPPGRKDVVVDAEGRFLVDGKPVELDALSQDLKAAVAADPKTWVALKVAGSTPYSTVAGLLRTLRSLSVADVRVVPVGSEPAKP